MNQYIDGLLVLRRRIDDLIDNEIRNTCRGQGNSEILKDSLEYIIEDQVLNGRYKADEKKKV